MKSSCLAIVLFSVMPLLGPVQVAVPQEQAERVPVVIELFTSEGCSSCPPADRLLARLDRTQPGPIQGAEVIALEMHVDYWNGLGWADPFSQASFTRRQHEYARDGRVYTPQMIVDGQASFVGSDERAAKEAIAAAARQPTAPVKLVRRGDRLQVTVPALPPGSEPADLWLALTERGLSTQVERGENAGSTLSHGPVVRALSRLGQVGGGFLREVPLPSGPGWERRNLRAVVFLQGQRSRRVLGAAQVTLDGLTAP
jgi:hypothetical protein